MDWTSIVAVLVWLVTGGGAGLFAYWIWGELEGWFPAIGNLAPRPERYLTTVLTIAIGALGFLVQVWLGYTDYPIGLTEWIERVFSVVALAVISALTAHGRTLKNRI